MIVFCVVAGVALGMLAGFLPGITVTTIVIVTYPALASLSILEIFAFYIALVSTLQYYGSISAIVFGVLGETSSAPAVFNGNRLFRAGYGDSILTGTATSSLIGSLIGLTMFSVLAFNIEPLLIMFSSKVKILMLALILVVSVVWCKSKLLGSIFVVAGLIMGAADMTLNPLSKLFPSHSIFSAGIPLFPVMIGMLIAPVVVGNMKIEHGCLEHYSSTTTPFERFKYLLKIEHLMSTVRGSVIGGLVGAIPGVSFAISSNLAESFEKMLHNNDESNSSLKKNLYAAEAANNAGSIVVLAPFVLFALPIVTSEALILGLLESKGFALNYAVGFIQTHTVHIVSFIFSVNVLNWIVSGFFYNSIIRLYSVLKKCIYQIVLVGCVLLSLYLGWMDFQFLLTVGVLVISTIIGFAVKCDNTKMSYLFGFFLSNELIPEMYRQYLIYFT